MKRFAVMLCLMFVAVVSQASIENPTNPLPDQAIVCVDNTSVFATVDAAIDYSTPAVYSYSIVETYSKDKEVKSFGLVSSTLLEIPDRSDYILLHPYTKDYTGDAELLSYEAYPTDYFEPIQKPVNSTLVNKRSNNLSTTFAFNYRC